MFNEIDQDCLHTPSPQVYRVNAKSKLDTRYGNGIQFPLSRRKNLQVSYGQGPAAYNCPGQFDTIARKTFNIRYRREAFNNVQSWKVRKRIMGRIS